MQKVLRNAEDLFEHLQTLGGVELLQKPPLLLWKSELYHLQCFNETVYLDNIDSWNKPRDCMVQWKFPIYVYELREAMRLLATPEAIEASGVGLSLHRSHE